MPYRSRDEVGVPELVALLVADRLEADAERRQPVLAGLGQQADDEARVEAAREQHADRHVGDEPALDGEAQRRLDRVAPLVVGAVPAGLGPAVTGPSTCVWRAAARRARSTSIVAGGSFCTPQSIVRGAGTTAWNVR